MKTFSPTSGSKPKMWNRFIEFEIGNYPFSMAKACATILPGLWKRHVAPSRARVRNEVANHFPSHPMHFLPGGKSKTTHARKLFVWCVCMMCSSFHLQTDIFLVQVNLCLLYLKNRRIHAQDFRKESAKRLFDKIMPILTQMLYISHCNVWFVFNPMSSSDSMMAERALLSSPLVALMYLLLSIWSCSRFVLNSSKAVAWERFNAELAFVWAASSCWSCQTPFPSKTKDKRR